MTARGTTPDVGLGDAIRAVAGTYATYSGTRALADRADELEAAYRVADAEIARLGEFHDHYRAQVEAVRGLRIVHPPHHRVNPVTNRDWQVYRQAQHDLSAVIEAALGGAQ